MTPTVPRRMCVGCGYTASQLGRNHLLSFYTLVGRAGLWSVTVTKQQGQGKHLCGGFQVTESGVFEAGRAPNPGIPATPRPQPRQAAPCHPQSELLCSEELGRLEKQSAPKACSLASSGRLCWKCPLSLLQKMSTSKRYMCPRTHFIKLQTQSSAELLQGLN